MVHDHLHQITVDGDTSTNDCVIGMASGASGIPTVKDPSSKEAVLLEAALTALMQVGARRCGWVGAGCVWGGGRGEEGRCSTRGGRGEEGTR